jgi:hypothetical protein
MQREQELFLKQKADREREKPLWQDAAPKLAEVVKIMETYCSKRDACSGMGQCSDDYCPVRIETSGDDHCGIGLLRMTMTQFQILEPDTRE